MQHDVAAAKILQGDHELQEQTETTGRRGKRGKGDRRISNAGARQAMHKQQTA